MCQTIRPKNFMFVFDPETELLWTVSCLIVHLAFLTSCNLLFFSLYKTSKNNIFGFLSFSLGKLFKSRSLKLNISRTAQRIVMILVSFCRILNGLSDEINLFCRCSSPSTPFLSTHISNMFLQFNCNNPNAAFVQ